MSRKESGAWIGCETIAPERAIVETMCFAERAQTERGRTARMGWALIMVSLVVVDARASWRARGEQTGRVQRAVASSHGGRRLRGGDGSSGGDGDGVATRTLVVPSTECKTLQDALDMACQGDVCRVSRGSHGFSRPGPYPLQRRSLSLVGEDGCWVHGRWYCEESTGNATGLNFYADPARDSEEDMRLRGRVVQVVAGSWVLTSCSIQCVDGIPLATLERSSIEADACVFGGTEASVYMSSCGHDDSIHCCTVGY